MNGHWRNALGQTLVWLCLTSGTLAAATAYLVPLDRADEDLIGLTLTVQAGRQPNQAGAAPLLEEGTRLAAEPLAALRAAGVRYVRVKEFSLGRWPGRWWFLLSVVGLVAGAVLSKTARQAQIAAEIRSEQRTPPEQILAELQAAASGLVTRLHKISDDAERLEAITKTVGQWQRSLIDRFVEARPALVARLGLGGYADLMSSFAAAERQFNRAWCAAADQHEPEALASLHRAAELLQEAHERLARG